MRIPALFLKCHRRFKNGKDHRYWSVCENRRTSGGRRFQRQVFYLGEINDTQKAGWTRLIEAFDESAQAPKTVALFPEDREVPVGIEGGIQVRLGALSVERPRQWGACWLALKVWDLLQLDSFWSDRLPPSREGTQWLLLLKAMTVFRLIDPGSEWRLHRQWFDGTALHDLLGPDFQLGGKDNLYRTLDLLVAHKAPLFSFLRQQWEGLFAARFEVLLYDLTSTYFESDPPFPEGDKRKFGYSRDKRPDCVQVVIAVVLTPEGFPLAYEVFHGNTSDKTTLHGMLARIEGQYGKVQRIWLMDRGIPTEETLKEMRQSDPPVQYLVGTPKGRLSALERKFQELSWRQAREHVRVKLQPEEAEVYVLVESKDRLAKERSMRRERLGKYWKRLKELQQRKSMARDELLKQLGAAEADAGRVKSLLVVEVPAEGQEVSAETFRFRIDRAKFRRWYRREGRYLLRSNLAGKLPGQLWELYLRLVEIEEAFRNLKGDLAIRPVYHQKEKRIEAHIFVAFLSYCLHVSLRAKLRHSAPGLTSREALAVMGQMAMADVRVPTTDGRELIFRRHTKPEPAQKMLLAQLKWDLPSQPPPQITSEQTGQPPKSGPSSTR